MKVTAFKSLDGSVHLEEKPSIERDFSVEIRGVLQSNFPSLKSGSGNLSVEAFSNCVVQCREDVAEVMTKYRRKLQGIDRRGQGTTVKV
jgi:hypothetical protein